MLSISLEIIFKGINKKKNSEQNQEDGMKSKKKNMILNKTAMKHSNYLFK